MADFNQILTPGDVDGGIINVVNEIPAGSNHKIEWNRKLAAFQLDRVEPAIFAKPTNYGFIPQTLDEDGDELDVLLVTEQPLATGVFLEARVIGVMKFVDDGEVDDKIVCVPADDRNNGNAYKTLADLPQQLIKQIEFHFNHYKDLKKSAIIRTSLFSGKHHAPPKNLFIVHRLVHTGIHAARPVGRLSADHRQQSLRRRLLPFCIRRAVRTNRQPRPLPAAQIPTRRPTLTTKEPPWLKNRKKSF